MDFKELTDKLKNDLTWKLELNRVGMEAGLVEMDKIYLIYLAENEAVFGVRHAENSLDMDHLRQSLGVLVTQQADTAYELETIKIFERPIDELDYVLAHSDLGAYIQSHGGSCEVLSADEKTGVVTVSLTGTCSTCSSSMMTMKMGVENFLTEILPWVKKVETPDEPQDPDFGIEKVLEEAEKETGNGSSMISEGGPSTSLEQGGEK